VMERTSASPRCKSEKETTTATKYEMTRSAFFKQTLYNN